MNALVRDLEADIIREIISLLLETNKEKLLKNGNGEKKFSRFVMLKNVDEHTKLPDYSSKLCMDL